MYLKKSQFLCHMEHLSTKDYGNIFLRLFRTSTHGLKAVLAPHLDGGQSHDEGRQDLNPGCWHSGLILIPYTN